MKTRISEHSQSRSCWLVSTRSSLSVCRVLPIGSWSPGGAGRPLKLATRVTRLWPLVLATTLAILSGCRPTDQNHADTAVSSPAEPPEKQAVSLDGARGAITVPDTLAFHSLSNAMTLEVWFKANSFAHNDMGVNSLLRKNVEAGQENFFLRFRTMRGRPTIEMCCGSRIGILGAAYNFEPGNWYHLAGTYDGDSARIYVNGLSVGKQRLRGQMEIDDSELVIGRGDPLFSGGEYFDGELAAIRIWNVARSPEQILAGMSAPLTGSEPGLVAYWNFADGKAKDLSGHGNDGKLSGDAKIIPVKP